MLQIVREDYIKYPIEAKDRIQGHSGVVRRWALVAEVFSQERVLGVWIAET